MTNLEKELIKKENNELKYNEIIRKLTRNWLK